MKIGLTSALIIWETTERLKTLRSLNFDNLKFELQSLVWGEYKKMMFWAQLIGKRSRKMIFLRSIN